MNNYYVSGVTVMQASLQSFNMLPLFTRSVQQSTSNHNVMIIIIRSHSLFDDHEIVGSVGQADDNLTKEL